MNQNCIYYATCFYDIGRSDWKNFSRTFDEYLTEFEPLLELFSKENEDKHKLFVFLDEKFIKLFQEKNIPVNVMVIKIDENWLKKHTQWEDVEDERKIMESDEYKEIVGDRIKFPESHIPEYTMINHIKIDFLKHIYEYYLEGNLSKKYLAWLDFGFFKKDHLKRGADNYIPQRLLDPEYFDTDKINYTVINPITEQDIDVKYTLKNAPERVAGYFFFLRADKLVSYHKLYTDTLTDFRNNGYADDDQHLVLQCYARLPNFFKFHQLPWHTALVKFQNSESFTKEFLQKIFNPQIISLPENVIFGSDEMLTFLGIGLNLEECQKLKKTYPNSKIYNLHEKVMNIPNYSGIVEIVCQSRSAKEFLPDKDEFNRILKRDLRCINLDRVFYAK